MVMPLQSNKPCGFTLAELLIALAILGVIATFTIPKVLLVQQNQQYKAIGKEFAGMIEGAYQQYQLRNTVTAATQPSDLVPYMNYVNHDTTSIIDHAQTVTSTGGVLACNSSQGAGNYTCYTLHNGAKFLIRDYPFGGMSPSNAIYFFLDPDGKVTDGTTNGPGKSVVFWLYLNGHITTWGGLDASVDNNGDIYSPQPAYDPPWFSWS